MHISLRKHNPDFLKNSRNPLSITHPPSTISFRTSRSHSSPETRSTTRHWRVSFETCLMATPQVAPLVHHPLLLHQPLQSVLIIDLDFHEIHTLSKVLPMKGQTFISESFRNPFYLSAGGRIQGDDHFVSRKKCRQIP